MSIEAFIREMPKVELHLHLHGAIPKQTLLLIAEQNEVAESTKHFKEWVKLLDNPDYHKLDDLIQITSQWIQQPEDLTRVVYDVGVDLAKQNVRYAEVSIDPTLYADKGIDFETFLSAVNDGRDRVQRGWNVRINWILTIPRDQPRKADDVSRQASSVIGRKAGIVALGLSGKESAQPIGQFERAFKTVEKKGILRAPHAGDMLGAEGILEAIERLNPDRIYDGWGAADAPDVIALLKERYIALNICIAHDLCHQHVDSYAGYPLRHLYDEGVTLVLGSDMPTFYKSSLSDEYLAVLEHNGFVLEEIEDIALNAVRTSALPVEEKEAMLSTFTETYHELRTKHISQPTR
jgi:adenosine deaminase